MCVGKNCSGCWNDVIWCNLCIHILVRDTALQPLQDLWRVHTMVWAHTVAKSLMLSHTKSTVVDSNINHAQIMPQMDGNHNIHHSPNRGFHWIKHITVQNNRLRVFFEAPFLRINCSRWKCSSSHHLATLEMTFTLVPKRALHVPSFSTRSNL